MLVLSYSFCTTRTLLEIVVAMLLENWVALLSALELEGYISCYYITSCLEFAMTWLTGFLRAEFYVELANRSQIVRLRANSSFNNCTVKKVGPGL